MGEIVIDTPKESVVDGEAEQTPRFANNRRHQRSTSSSSSESDSSGSSSSSSEASANLEKAVLLSSKHENNDEYMRFDTDSKVRQKVSEDTANLHRSHSWRKGTAGVYNSAWKQWSSWCGQRKADPFCSTVTSGADYLTELF